MIGYPFISDLFKNVLTNSRAIEGRFFTSSHQGREINMDDVGQLIQDFFLGNKLARKYPLCLALPPVSYGMYTSGKGEWESFRQSLFFLTSTYYSGTNQIMNPNPATGTSTHTIQQDWHDMKRCATSFVRVLDIVSRKSLINKFRLSQDRERIITPVSQIGTDKCSGVRLDLSYSVFNGCEIEDYDESLISTIIIPVDDSHPEHQL